MEFVKTIEGVSKRVIPQKMFPEELEMWSLLLQLPIVQGLGYVGWRTGTLLDACHDTCNHLRTRNAV